MQYRIAVFAGDGIGPEIMAPTLQLLKTIAHEDGRFSFAFEDLPAGANCYLEQGSALPDSSVGRARANDAILLSAMGLPSVRYEDGTEMTPQIDLRFKLDLYAGVRPVKLYAPHTSPLKDARVKDMDFVLVRESTEGLFAHMHEGQIHGRDAATETLRITRSTSEKLFNFSFRLAEQRAKKLGRPGKVTCVDKANVFKSFWFFREIFAEIANTYPAVANDAAYVDAMAMWMVQRPWDYDVLVTENMFGDILSDLAAGIMGTLGLAPSADIGDDAAVFQPCHGSAPDIAGKGIANPLAMILSAAMMLEWLGTEHNDMALSEAGARLEEAVADVVRDAKHLTRDLGGNADTNDCATAVETRYLMLAKGTSPTQRAG